MLDIYHCHRSSLIYRCTFETPNFSSPTYVHLEQTPTGEAMCDLEIRCTLIASLTGFLDTVDWPKIPRISIPRSYIALKYSFPTAIKPLLLDHLPLTANIFCHKIYVECLEDLSHRTQFMLNALFLNFSNHQVYAVRGRNGGSEGELTMLSDG